MNSISSFTKSIGVGGCASQDKVDKIFVSMARMSFGENEFLLNSARKLNLNFFFPITFAAMFRVVRDDEEGGICIALVAPGCNISVKEINTARDCFPREVEMVDDTVSPVADFLPT